MVLYIQSKVNHSAQIMKLVLLMIARAGLGVKRILSVHHQARADDASLSFSTADRAADEPLTCQHRGQLHITAADAAKKCLHVTPHVLNVPRTPPDSIGSGRRRHAANARPLLRDEPSGSA